MSRGAIYSISNTLFCSALVLVGTQSVAASTRIMGYESGWKLTKFTDHCAMEKGLDSGTLAQIILFDDKPDIVGILLANPAWKSLVEGQKVSTIVTFENFEKGKPKVFTWTSPATAHTKYGPQIAIGMKQPLLSGAFSAGRRIIVSTEDTELAEIPLGGVRPMLRLVECVLGKRDPFAKLNEAPP